eukprot:gene1210-1320_t
MEAVEHGVFLLSVAVKAIALDWTHLLRHSVSLNPSQLLDTTRSYLENYPTYFIANIGKLRSMLEMAWHGRNLDFLWDTEAMRYCSSILIFLIAVVVVTASFNIDPSLLHSNPSPEVSVPLSVVTDLPLSNNGSAAQLPATSTTTSDAAKAIFSSPMNEKIRRNSTLGKFQQAVKLANAMNSPAKPAQDADNQTTAALKIASSDLPPRPPKNGFSTPPRPAANRQVAGTPNGRASAASILFSPVSPLTPDTSLNEIMAGQDGNGDSLVEFSEAEGSASESEESSWAGNHSEGSAQSSLTVSDMSLHDQPFQSVLQQSVNDPNVLIGWRVLIRGQGAGVILSMKRKKFTTTRFVVQFENGRVEALPLRRSKKKGTVAFTLLSKLS